MSMGGMNMLVVAPIVVPLVTLVVLMLGRRHAGMVAWVSVLGALALTLVGLRLVGLAASDVVIAGQLGGWQAPYGISVVIDRQPSACVAETV